MVFIAEDGGDGPVLASDIARKTKVPKQYLSSILRDATHAGLLKSTRGRGGGFRLARPTHRIRLLDIFRPYDDVESKTGCPFGQARCNDDNPCVFHDYWKPVAEAYKQMLTNTTIADLVADKLVQLEPRRRKGR